MLYWTDISDAARGLANDPIAPYRFSDDQLITFGNDSIKELRRIRPASCRNSDLEYVSFKELSYGGLFEYTDTGAQLIDYYKITGWNRETYPILYFKSGSASQIDMYASSAHRTAGTPKLAHILQSDTVGDKTVTVDNSSGFGGRITSLKNATLNETWEVSAEEQQIEIDPMFKDPLVYMIAGKCLEIDNEDTVDANRSNLFIQRFYQILTQ